MNKKIVEIKMPQLAESLVTATLSCWLKKIGQQVQEYEPICEVLTDKVNAELPSTVTGKLIKQSIQPGETVNVGTVIGLIEIAEQQAEQQMKPDYPPHSKIQAQSEKGSDTNFLATGSLQHRYSPAVQKLAAEHHINLNDVHGTGQGGRITRKDVSHWVAAKVPSVQEIPHQPALPPIKHSVGIAERKKEEEVEITQVRRTIAERMQQCTREVPHGWTMVEVDVSPLVVLRKKRKAEFYKREGINLTYIPFFIKAVVGAIKDYPMLNARWRENKIIVNRDINISLSVGTEDFVVTPVIHQADQKNIAGLAHEVTNLALRARDNKLKLEDMKNGTFTINNTGSFGSILSQPILNYPQAAILTFESIVKRPVVIDDMIAIRSMVNLCLSIDHRVLDGVICGRFLQRVKENLEKYNDETFIY